MYGIFGSVGAVPGRRVSLGKVATESAFRRGGGGPGWSAWDGVRVVRSDVPLILDLDRVLAMTGRPVVLGVVPMGPRLAVDGVEPNDEDAALPVGGLAAEGDVVVASSGVDAARLARAVRSTKGDPKARLAACLPGKKSDAFAVMAVIGGSVVSAARDLSLYWSDEPVGGGRYFCTARPSGWDVSVSWSGKPFLHDLSLASAGERGTL
jgi:hypothetical protein